MIQRSTPFVLLLAVAEDRSFKSDKRLRWTGSDAGLLYFWVRRQEIHQPRLYVFNEQSESMLRNLAASFLQICGDIPGIGDRGR